MPLFKVEYQVTPPHQYRDIEANDRDQAIAMLVEEESANGEVSVTRCSEIEEVPVEDPAAQPAA
jgi:hypothetical protein